MSAVTPRVGDDAVPENPLLPEPQDPIDELLERLRPVVLQTVDYFHLAASLESDGITDDVARDQFGYPDVFELAEEIRRRAGTARGAATIARKTRQRWWADAHREIGHGLLYLLPAAVFPVGLVLLDPGVIQIGIIALGAAGWIWAGGASWFGYRMLGRGCPGSAALVMRWSSVALLPVGALIGVAVIMATGTGYGLIAVGVGQVTFQMASTLAMFYRRENLLYCCMIPAVLAGIAFLVAGRPVLPIALVVVAGSLAAALVVGLLQTRNRLQSPEPPVRESLRGELRQFPVVLFYTALCAAFFLQAQARYMLAHFDVLVAFLPLIVGMGVVEWRTRRFTEQSRELLLLVRYPRDFVRRVWLLLLRNMAYCSATVSVLVALVVIALATASDLEPAALVVAATCVLLSAVYLIGFLLANMGRFRWLCASLAAATGLYAGVEYAVPHELSLLAGAALFTASVVLLLLLYIVALAGPLGQARSFRR